MTTQLDQDNQEADSSNMTVIPQLKVVSLLSPYSKDKLSKLDNNVLEYYLMVSLFCS
jgi:hypothetical protein